MNILLVIILTLFAVFSRLMPHPPNFTPLLAIALYSGFSFKNKFLFIIPLLGMLVSDLFLGYYSSIIWIYVSLLIPHNPLRQATQHPLYPSLQRKFF